MFARVALLLVSQLVTQLSPVDPLYITVQEESSESIRVTAAPDHSQISKTVLVTSSFRDASSKLYEALEIRPPLDEEAQRLSVKLGRQVLEPFRHLIESADEIVFVVSEELLETPLDLLYFNDRPLFLQLPVSYRIAPPRSGYTALPTLKSALVISDPSADPDGAARVVSALFGRATYLDARKVSRKLLQEQNPFDLLLVSAHGRVGANDDHIGLGGLSARASDLLSISPQLAYFDSCRLGVSREFLGAFAETETLYFVAPILSNEAGNSSTRTMNSFFEFLTEGQRPEVALFETRSRLWELYESDEFGTRVRRAFPFRVYHLD